MEIDMDTNLANKYGEFSDEELMVKLRQGDSQITDYIMNKYKNLVRKKAQSMYILGADGEDLIQEGMIGLFKAVRDYDIGRDVNFFTFAELCIARQIYTAVQASNRKKHMPLNTYVSLYSEVGNNHHGEQDGGESALVNALPSRLDRNPEEMIIDRENVERLEQIIETELSDFEKQVLDLFMTGMTYVEIAKVLGRDGKSTDNALQRIKMKIRKAMG